MAQSKIIVCGENKNSNSPHHPIYSEYHYITNRWMLELLVPLGAHKDMILEHLCRDDDVLHELGLSDLAEAAPFNQVAIRTALFDLYKAIADKPLPKIPTSTQLAKNIGWLGESIGLSPTEQTILHFRVIISRHLPLRACMGNLGNGIDLLLAVNLLARLLGTDESEIERALQPGARLLRTGLISVEHKLTSLIGKIEILPGLADNLLGMHNDPHKLFQNNFIQSGAPKLTREDYPHLKEDISLLSGYLLEALQTKRPGVNVLIYGTPGSGKTEFVKMLAQQIGCRLFEVATENAAGDPVRRADRFRSFRLAQHILADDKTHPLVLFDEVEDVFRIREDDDDAKGGNSSGIKGWINKLLEGNQIPSFWLSNNLQCLDKAFVRRFDYVIELNAPPRSVRSKILDQYLDGMDVSPTWKSNMAEHEHLNPAVVERVAKVVEVARQRQPELHAERALERMLGNTLEALGLPRSPKNAAQCVTDYRLDILNTDSNISDICEGLQQYGEGRLCLYGPPGTGKSAFGRYLADALDRPLMLRRASDILSPYLGIAEKNIAKMFREAAEENAVLLLDEADTFLRDRTGAVRSWEVSEVNEMLTQMENFAGIFIATTNLMGSLDAAALRRFDMKVKFDYLKPAQAWQLFVDITTKFNIEPTEADRAVLDKLYLLTPGDFANIARQSRLRKIQSTSELIERLAAECKVKPEGIKQAIGFL
jgi:transitional endoplasmic reticulum ATPase